MKITHLRCAFEFEKLGLQLLTNEFRKLINCTLSDTRSVESHVFRKLINCTLSDTRSVESHVFRKLINCTLTDTRSVESHEFRKMINCTLSDTRSVESHELIVLSSETTERFPPNALYNRHKVGVFQPP